MDIRNRIEYWFPNIIGKDFKIFNIKNKTVLERYLKCKVIRDYKCYINRWQCPNGDINGGTAHHSYKHQEPDYVVDFKKDKEFLFKVEDGRYFLKGKADLFTLNVFEIDKTDFENFFISKREENLNSILNS